MKFEEVKVQVTILTNFQKKESVMHQVSYSSSVSTFCRNEIKDRNYKSVQQHIFISFSFSGKKWLAPPMLDVIFIGNFPQPPLNHSREKE